MSAAGRGPRLGGPDDFYSTPAWCVHRLLEAWRPRGGWWLEPSAGNGAIIRAVNAVRSDVQWLACEVRPEETDGLFALVDPIGGENWTADFLADDLGYAHDQRPSVVIGNPPYSLAAEFIQRSIDLFPSADLALLLRLNFAASEKRAQLMRCYTPDVYVLPNRPSFRNGGTDATEYAWFVWPAIGRSNGAGRFEVLRTTPAGERRAPAQVAA